MKKGCMADTIDSVYIEQPSIFLGMKHDKVNVISNQEWKDGKTGSRNRRNRMGFR